MELQRGTCRVCPETNRIMSRMDAQNFIDLIPQIYSDHFLDSAKFQKVKDSIKLCALCCCKLQSLSKSSVNFNKLTEFDDQERCCYCQNDSQLFRITSDSKYFIARTMGLIELSGNVQVRLCMECFRHLDTFAGVKAGLLSHYPQLKPTRSPNESIKRKSATPASSSSKKRKSSSSTASNNCFKDLKPLVSNTYKISSKLKRDKKIYRNIPYVNMSKRVVKKILRETPKSARKSIIKIKWGPSSLKKSMNGNRTNGLHDKKDEEIDETPRSSKKPRVSWCLPEDMEKKHNKNSPPPRSPEPPSTENHDDDDNDDDDNEEPNKQTENNDKESEETAEISAEDNGNDASLSDTEAQAEDVPESKDDNDEDDATSEQIESDNIMEGEDCLDGNEEVVDNDHDNDNEDGDDDDGREKSSSSPAYEKCSNQDDYEDVENGENAEENGDNTDDTGNDNDNDTTKNNGKDVEKKEKEGGGDGRFTYKSDIDDFFDSFSTTQNQADIDEFDELAKNVNGELGERPIVTTTADDSKKND